MAGIAQVISSDSASGAQVIEGSLKFDDSPYLEFTPSSTGNRRTFTLSYWVKRNNFGQHDEIFGADDYSSSGDFTEIRFDSDDRIQLWMYGTSTNGKYETTSPDRRFRDNGWYHIVVAVDSTQTDPASRVKLYINGELYDVTGTSTNIGENEEFRNNLSGQKHLMGYFPSAYAAVNLSNFYSIDGLALGPGYFGYNDPLTGTWRPKKFKDSGTTVNNGTVWTDKMSNTGLIYSGTASNVFNGNATPWTSSNYASFNVGTLTLFSGVNVTARNNIRIHGNMQSYDNIVINGVNYHSDGDGANKWITPTGVTYPININSLAIDTTPSNVQNSLSAIEIDGVIMKDSTTQNVGYNGTAEGLGGVTWSSYVTGSVDGSYPLSNCFGGTIGSSYTSGTRSTVPGSLTLNIAALNLNVTNVRLNTYLAGSPTLTVNGSAVSIPGSADQTHVVAVNGQLNTIVWSYDSIHGPYCYMRGIEVDLGDGNGYQLLTDGAGTAAGVNGFYLPFDGQTPIGEDQSGNGNNWTPVNFGNYVDLDEATGAFPILNTTQGGTQATVGVREDSLANGDSSDPLDRVFSNYTTASGGFSDSYPKTNLFDGQAPADANRAEAATNNDPIDITFNPPITVSSTVSLWSGKSSTQYQINNSGSYTSYSDAVGSYKDISHSGSLSNIKILHGNTSYAAGISAIKIDGTQLTDVPGLVLALPLISNAKDVSNQFKSPLLDKTLTRLRFRTDWNWMYVSAIEINGTILTTGTLDNSGGVWTDDTKWKNGSVGSGQETYSQSARGDWFDVTLASTIEFETLRIYVYLDSSAGSTTNTFELELFFQDGSTLTQIHPRYDDAPTGNYNGRFWQDYGDMRQRYGHISGTTTNGESNFYGASQLFDGSNDYVKVGNCPEFIMGTNDFTMECWVYVHSTSAEITVLGYKHTAQSGWTGYKFYLNTNAAFIFYAEDAGSGGWDVALDAGNNSIATNTWQHLAVTRSGDTFRIFVDGVLKNTTTSSVNLNDPGTEGIFIGQNGASQQWMDGNIQDVRIYKGVAKYTSDFNPGTTNPVILPDTPSGVSGGSKLTKIIDGAVSFDGTDDYLSIPTSTDFAFGTGDFTIEAFCYRQPGKFFTLFDHLVGVGNFTIFAYANDVIQVYNNAFLSSGVNPGNNKWFHLAVVRQSGVLSFYIDGIKASNTHSFTFNFTTAGVNIGVTQYSEYSTGFISNLRVIKGTALYTSNFNPPSAPLTNVTNTKLLCCQSNTSAVTASVAPDAGTGTALLNIPLSSTPFADSSSTGATITNTGSIAAASAGTNNFDITNAASLDGSSQRLSTNNTNMSFTGSWTLDAWFKLDSSASGYNALFNTGYGSQTSNYMYFGINDDEKPYVEGGSAGGATTAANAINRNLWYQMRVRSDGLAIKQYIDGELVVTHGVNTTDMSSLGTKTIGSLLDNGNNANNFHGLIGPVRYVSSDLGPPVAGGESTSSGAVPNTPDLPDIIAGGDAAATTFNPFNTDINTVRGQETGYATLNPLNLHNTADTLSEGNLKLTSSGSGAGHFSRSTITMSSGKYFCEVKWLDVGQNFCGIQGNGDINYNNSYVYLSNAKATDTNGSSEDASYGSTWTTGDTIGVAYDADNKTLEFFKNGVSQGVAFTNITGTYDPNPTEYVFFFGNWSAQNATYVVNFGQKPFKFSPPDGYQSLNAANVRPETVISRPDQYFNTTLWSGDNTDPRQINLGMAPDLIWVKTRNQTNWHWLSDSLRGTVDKRYKLYSNAANAQDTAPIYGQADSFNGSGFVAGGGTDGSNPLSDSNQTGTNYVCWSWKAGGSSNTFNVDDVGYANASDVGMDVGGKNSAYYNQTSTWSSGLTNSGVTTPEHIFNGVLGEAGSNWATGTYAYSSVQASGGTLSGLNLPTGKYRIRAYSNNSAASIKINGGNTYTAPSGSANVNEWWDITETTITSIEWIAGTTVYVSGLECNGRLLLDNGTSIDGTNVLNVPSIANTGASVGTKQGFSIVKYTSNGTQGATIAHGLTQKPDFAIFKNIDSTLGVDQVDWGVYHTSIGATKHLELNQNIATGSDAGPFNNTEPTSTFFTFGGNPSAFSHSYLTNGPSGDDFIGYIWHNVPGLQKFGSYEGDTTNPAFIECGFRPAIVWIKAVDQTWYWNVQDTKRSPQNPSKGNFLRFDENYVENADSANNNIDFVSNGFKIRSTTAQSEPTNVNAQTYIYCAWAEQPSVNLYGAQSNAR